MSYAARTLSALALLLALTAPGTALADVNDYSGMVPERIEREMREERNVYQALKKELFALENGSQDKNSARYKALHEELLGRAVESKVRLDEMNEALNVQRRAFNY